MKSSESFIPLLVRKTLDNYIEWLLSAGVSHDAAFWYIKGALMGVFLLQIQRGLVSEDSALPELLVLRDEYKRQLDLLYKEGL